MFVNFYFKIKKNNSLLFLGFLSFFFITNLVVVYSHVIEGIGRHHSFVSQKASDYEDPNKCNVNDIECDRRKNKDSCISLIPVLDQKQVVACWAFASANHFSIMNCMATGEAKVYSPHEIVGCRKPEDAMNGGSGFEVLNFMSLGHWALEKDYKSEKVCERSESTNELPKSQFVGVMKVSKNNDDFVKSMKNAIAKVGSVEVGIGFNSIKSIYNSICFNKNDIFRSMLAVGWLVHEGTEYWILQNSFGENWRDHGYVYVATKNNNCPKDIYPINSYMFFVVDWFEGKNLIGFPPTTDIDANFIYDRDSFFKEYHSNVSYRPFIVFPIKKGRNNVFDSKYKKVYEEDKRQLYKKHDEKYNKGDEKYNKKGDEEYNEKHKKGDEEYNEKHKKGDQAEKISNENYWEYDDDTPLSMKCDQFSNVEGRRPSSDKISFSLNHSSMPNINAPSGKIISDKVVQVPHDKNNTDTKPTKSHRSDTEVFDNFFINSPPYDPNKYSMNPTLNKF